MGYILNICDLYKITCNIRFNLAFAIIFFAPELYSRSISFLAESRATFLHSGLLPALSLKYNSVTFTHLLHHGNWSWWTSGTIASILIYFQELLPTKMALESMHNLTVKEKYTSFLHDSTLKWRGINEINNFSEDSSAILLITVQYIDKNDGNSLPLEGNFAFPHHLLLSFKRVFMLTHI